MPKGFDAYASMKHGMAEKFAADGYQFSAGYLFVSSGFKVLRDRSECEAVTDAGMSNVLIFENGRPINDAYFNAAKGEYDHVHAIPLAIATGAVRNGTVGLYYAVDGDASSDPNGPVANYFRHVHGPTRDAGFLTGVYGSGAVCKMLVELGLVTKTWLSQSTGFPGYHDWLAKADIVQGHSANVHGIDIDYDISDGHAGGFKV